jgi:hypothetical protein
MGSIAMDETGNIAMGYSISSADMYPSIRYTGRMNGDPLGVMTIAEGIIVNGGGAQTNTWSGTPSRWGDYSRMVADPTDIGKFWYTTEYYASTSQANWKTRIGSFSFANILSVDATADPQQVCTGGTTQLNVTATGGSGTYTYEWTSVPAGFTSNLQNPTVNPAETTKYVSTVSDGTTSKADTVQVDVIQLPVANAGNDTVYCWWVSAFPVIGSATNSNHVTWTTAGDGHFLIDTIAAALYYPGSGDHANGSVTLTLTADAIAPCTQSHSDETVITFDPCTGMGEAAQDVFGMSINPNPAHGSYTLTVTGLNNSKVEVTMTDLQGRTAFESSYTSTGKVLVKTIDLSGFARGTYLVKIKTDKGVKSEKLIVQ